MKYFLWLWTAMIDNTRFHLQVWFGLLCSSPPSSALLCSLAGCAVRWKQKLYRESWAYIQLASFHKIIITEDKSNQIMESLTTGWNEIRKIQTFKSGVGVRDDNQRFPNVSEFVIGPVCPVLLIFCYFLMTELSLENREKSETKSE